ncbi:MAG: glycosyltransferase family 4 protein [candidate division WOR-3 bacterium]
MRILMVSDVYFPHIGGIPVHIYNLSRELKKFGHEVKILTTNYSTRILDGVKYLPDEEDVYRVGRALVIRSNKSWASVCFGFRLGKEVKKVLSYGFDIVHIHGSLAPTLPILALRHSQAKNLITLHSYYRRSKGYAFFRPFLLPYFKKLDGVIAVSQAAVRATRRYFPGEYCVIPNAIDPNQFSPEVPPLSQFLNHFPRILFVGRFEPKKGLKYLLQALPLVKKVFPNCLLLVIGAGLFGYSYKEYIDESVQKNVQFLGVINPQDIPSYYATCDIFCAPSVDCESFGIILLEAMACGKPVVASNIPGYQEVVSDGEDGFLVPPRSPKAIAEAIIRICQDEEKRREMGEAGRRKALTYSWENIGKKVEEFYKKLLRG